MYIYSTNANVVINNGTFTGNYAFIYFTYNKASKAAFVINDGIFKGYCEIDEKFTTNPDEEFSSNVVVYGGKFNEDLYEYAHDGSNWYLATNTKFIHNGYFAKIEDYFDWPKYVVSPFEATGIMNTSIAGYPYTIGHKIILKPNYEDQEDEIIYTFKDGSMGELYDISRLGYEFLGWNTNPDGTGTAITNNSIINESTILYATWRLIPGDVNVLVNDENDYEITVNTQELYDAVLTKEDEQLIEEGKNITIEIITKDITEEISNVDKEKILKGIDNKKIGAYIDISMIKAIDGQDDMYVSNTNEKIKITISVPQELISENNNKKFYIVRMHNDKVEILDSVYDANNNTITFETDKFSTYAIAYMEQENETSNDVTNKETTEDNKSDTITEEKLKMKEDISNNPKTGDNILLFILIFVISIIGIVITSKIKKSK